MARIARTDSFLFCCVRGPRPAFQKPLLPGSAPPRPPAGASGVALGACSQLSRWEDPPARGGRALEHRGARQPPARPRARAAPVAGRGAGAPGSGGRGRRASDRLRRPACAPAGTRVRERRGNLVPRELCRLRLQPGEPVSVAPPGMLCFVKMLSGAGSERGKQPFLPGRKHPLTRPLPFPPLWRRKGNPGLYWISL